MCIDIQARDFDLTTGLSDPTVRRLQFAPSRASYDLRTVTLRLFNINGPRADEGKRFGIPVALPGTQVVVIEDAEVDPYVAIDLAGDRAERAAKRRLERLREDPHDRLAGQQVTQVDTAQVAVVALNTD